MNIVNVTQMWLKSKNKNELTNIYKSGKIKMKYFVITHKLSHAFIQII